MSNNSITEQQRLMIKGMGFDIFNETKDYVFTRQSVNIAGSSVEVIQKMDEILNASLCGISAPRSGTELIWRKR